MMLVDGLSKYKQSWVYVPQGKLRLLAFKENIIVPLLAIKKRKVHHRMVSRRCHWSYLKEVIPTL
jgi:hypothetical protein